jgi:CheY-like chemotaxis protein
MASSPKCILVVDDEPAVRELVELLLRRLGHFVHTAESATEALAKLQTNDFDLVMTDFLMPGMRGDQLAQEIKKHRKDLPVVLLTGQRPEYVTPEIARVLGKPFSRDQLQEVVSALT